MDNILIVHNYYQIPGGEDSVVQNEKKLLESKGHKVIVYTRNNSEIGNMSIVKKLILPFTNIFSLITFREVRKIIIQNHITVVHVHNTLTLISPSVYYAAFSLKVPVIKTIHNFRLMCPGASFYRDGHICEDCVKKGIRCAIKHSCYRNNRLETLACVISYEINRIFGLYKKINYICLTDFNKEKLIHSVKQINADSVYIKPNFIFSDCRIVPYNKRKNTFVYAGRLEKIKGIEILLNAWKIVGNDSIKLIICGIGSQEENCRQFIAENNIKGIMMMGFVPNEEVRKIISESKALIMPTQWYEGFPMSIVEAFSVGTPVIGSDIGNVGDLIKDNINGMKFKHDSPQSLAHKIITINDMVGSTISYFKNRYTDEINYKILRKIYKDIKSKKLKSID